MENHFLDSNIFLSIAMADEAKIICEDYFKLSSIKFTSATVEIESNSVISKIEMISNEILESINKYVVTNNIPDEKILYSLKIVKKEFLDKYCFEDCPFGIKKEKFIRIVNRIFSYYYQIFKSYVHIPFPIWLNNERSNLQSLYKNYFLNLSNLFKLVHVKCIDECHEDKIIIDFLNDHEIHSPDSRILLDAFRTSELIDDYLLFVTRDHGILGNMDTIGKAFKRKIIPKKPEELLYN